MEDKRMIKHELAERLYEKCFLGFLDAFYPDEYLALISEYQQAVLLYEEIILQDGKAETEWVKQAVLAARYCGECFANTGNSEEALVYFEKAETLGEQLIEQKADVDYVPVVTESLVVIGDFYIRNKDYENAKRYFNKAQECVMQSKTEQKEALLKRLKQHEPSTSDTTERVPDNENALYELEEWPCPGCGSLINATMNFCVKCGAKAEKPEKLLDCCPNCGMKTSPEFVFCAKCGTRIKEG